MSVQTASGRAVLRLSRRLVRRGALILAAAGAAYVWLEVVSYQQSYPDAASRAKLATFQDNPSVRMLQGLARNVDTVGGFVAWDGGWFLETLAAIWALLAVVRLTRGDEETDRSALVLMTPLRAWRVLVLQLGTVWAAGLLFATVCSAVLVAFGVPAGSAALYGVGLAGFAATIAGMGALTGQLFDVRRRAVGAASGLLAAAYFVRMAGNSADAWSWLRWLTPYGWMDNLQPYGDTEWAALVLLVLTPFGLAGLSAVLRSRRDTGGATLPSTDSRSPHTRWLGTSVAFVWRSSRGALLAWGLGLAAYAALIGSLLPTLVSYLVDDPNLRKTLETYGIDVEDITAGMVSFMSTLFGLAFGLYACWRIGAARSEEDAGRADLLLVRPLTRNRWLGGHVLLATSSVLLLALTTALSMWAGGAVVGADLTVGDSLAATFNTVPVALLFLAAAVLLLGTRPRVTVALSASAAGVAYLLPVLGNALSLPMWVRDLSPFQHLETVPVHAYALTPGVVMLAVAVGLAALGMAAFDRRDLTGA